MKLFPLFIGLVIGNFLAEFVGDEEYMKAIERSYFQGIALFLVFITS